MNLRRRVLVPLVLVAVALLLGEGAARLVAPRIAWRPLPPFGHAVEQRNWLERSERELAEGLPSHRYTCFDAELGWTTVPKHVSPGQDIHINARGLRARREYAEAVPPGVRRVIACGESFTFGEEVLDEECWAARLEALDPALEVLNYGVGGYGTDQALLRLSNEARGTAETVLVGLMLENIGRNVNRYRPLWYTGAEPAVKPRYVLGAAGLERVRQPYSTHEEFAAAVRSGEVVARLAEHEYWAASPVPEWMLGSMVVRLLASQRAYAARELAPLYADTAGEPFRTTLALLEAFRPLARSLGEARLLVLVFPMRTDVAAFLRDGKRYWSTLLTALDAAGLPFLDLTDTLAAEARSAGVESLYLFSHFSKRANDLVARAVLERLDRDAGAQPK